MEILCRKGKDLEMWDDLEYPKCLIPTYRLELSEDYVADG